KKYTICEKHYNQIIAKDNCLNYLKGESSSYSRKQSCNFNTLNNSQIEPLTAVDIGIQVEINSNNDLLMQIEALKNSLNTLVAEHSKQVQIIEIKNNKIFELETECKYLKNQITDLNIRVKNLDLYRNQIEVLVDEKNKLEITEQEAKTLKNENTMKKEELISVNNSILVSFPESQRLKYTNLKNKTKVMLLMILQEIRGLNNTEEAMDEEYEDNESANEEIK
ncbi:17900_t:CDS:2, partial [Racocetra fulgida]